MKATIQIVGADLLCRSLGTLVPESRIDGATARATLQGWAERYDKATQRGDETDFFAIGRALFDWINPNGWASTWAKASGPRQLEIVVEDPAEPLARALLDAPWELLAHEQGYLADDAVQLFELARRVGLEGSPAEPRHGDLQLIFMAAAPAGENSLAFEDEESAILEATQRLPLHLVVEESGCIQFLGERLDLDGPFEALHLSCHGDIDPNMGPLLVLEDETGQLALTDVGQLVRALGNAQSTPLVFLSACRTAEQIEAGARAASEPFVRELVRAGVANVLGWDGSVYDADALAYARSFYGELASLQPVPRAAAVARQTLRMGQIKDPRQGRHWHLARLYLGPEGGGRLAARGKPKRKPAGGGDQFLDAARREVPVAGPQAFVGRRRPIQSVLKAYRNGAAGVLIHGMGNIGKSSLAFRVCTRMTRHEKVVVFGKYDALSVFDRVVAALPPLARKPAIDTWRDAVLADPAQLAVALEALLEGPLDAEPILLVVDDLERILETPGPSAAVTLVQAAYRPVLAAILLAFQRAQTESRLLVTSRYRFSLTDGGGGDLAETLARVPLQAMDDTERTKQLRAAARIAKVDDLAGVDTALLQRALDAAQGIPGLQAVLTRPILIGENAVAGKALAAIEHYQETGAPPDDIRDLMARGVAGDEASAIVAFFKRMAFDTYRAALTPDQMQMLRACCVFTTGVPVPKSAVEAAGGAAGVAEAPAALDRLLGLGLVDDWGAESGAALVAANPLARPLADSLEAGRAARLASAALPELERHWRDPAGRFPRDARAVEVARLARRSDALDSKLLNDATEAAALFVFKVKHNARCALNKLLKPALARLDAAGGQPATGLLLVTADCAERLGERPTLDNAIERLGRVTGDGPEAGSAKLRFGRWHRARGAIDAAAMAFAEAAALFQQANHEREWAIARGELADFHRARGNLDEALRILREETLPVYEKLNDLRSRAVTLGQISEVYEARGELDEALRIRQEEELPVYERLGDVRSRAVTMDQIADIYQARSKFEEALRIRRDTALPIFKKLGDVRQGAVTLSKIADIHMVRGELDEALRILREEVLPVCEKLGDARQRAIALSKIADIHKTHGKIDEALRIHREEVLPVFETQGEVRERAVTLGKIADIHKARGDLDEALRIREEEELPIYVRLGDVRQRAVTLAKIADICQTRGELDKALCIRREEALPVFAKLGDVHSQAVILGQIADIFEARNELDEAFRIRREEVLPVFEKLPDVRNWAVTLAKIADVHEARGELDQALHIRRDKVLPVFERMDEVRERAITLDKIADIHQTRGELGEALRIRREETLPVFEKLGDVRELAATLLRIADIHRTRGEFDEALRIYREEVLPVLEKLDDVGSRAVILQRIAGIYQARDEFDEALRILIEEALPIFEKLSDVHGKAVTMGKFADILVARGELDEALRIRQEEELPAFERLGDVRSKAVTMGKIADMLVARGELDEALALHEERLPIAERLGDLDTLVNVRYSRSNIRLLRGDHERDGLQAINEDLTVAFRFSCKLGRPDYISAVGWLLAQVLVQGELSDEALPVLDATEAALRKLGNAQGLAQVAELRARIGAPD